MYERFTDRARKVMQLANQEAQRLNHEYIGTGHLLLGLVKEGSGVAANVLKNLGIDLDKIRLEVEKVVESGSDKVTMGKLPQTPRTRSVIEHATEEADNLHDRHVGTEHLLLGLIRDEEGVASQVLRNLGVKMETLRDQVLIVTSHTMPTEDRCHTPLSRDNLRTEEGERIRVLEQQLWNVRIVLGALAGALAGTLLASSTGAVLGLIVGGGVAALGRRIPAALIAGVAGMMLGSAHLPMDGGGVAGALLGSLVGFLIAEIGRPIARH